MAKREIEVNNENRLPKSSGMGKLIWYLSFLLVIPLILHVLWRNSLIRKEFSINEMASGIEVQLKKRRDTLIKLVDATKSYVKYEKSTLNELTKLRKSTFSSSEEASNLNKTAAAIMAVAENYPNLKTNELVKETMEQASYLEREIGAARRLYNSQVTSFNRDLFTWPSNVIASSMNVSTHILFETDEESKKDVSLNF